MHRPVKFYSEGVRLAGDLFLPDGLRARERRAGIVLCHGYTGVRNLYLPDIAAILTKAGYVVLTFDYKGWGDSEGPPARLAPYSRVADVQAALTFLALQPEADRDRLGIYGTSYGGASATALAGCAACAGPTNISTCWSAAPPTAPDAYRPASRSLSNAATY